MAKTKQNQALPAVKTRDEGTAWHQRVAAGEHILEVEQLTISATSTGKAVVKDVDLNLSAGEILGLVGESGSGKTTVGLAILGHIRSGLVHSGGTVTLYASHSEEPAEMLALDRVTKRRLRGTRVSYIPQDPALSLNPAMRVGKQIREVLDIHGYGSNESERAERVRSVLREVGLPDDEAYQKRWPHQLSGGQQQRIGIAMAFAMYPDVIVLDEPTTGLDVTTQAQVLETIRDMTVKHRVAGLYITHDLAVISEISDRVAVMLQGELVEVGDAATVLYHPQHTYTKRLLAAVPDLAGKNQIGRFSTIDVKTSEFLNGEAGGKEDAGEPLTGDEGTGVPTVPQDAAVPLSVSDLSVSFGRNTVLRGIDLEIKEGECTLLLGESGSGKTTLARSIAGILDIYAGTVEYQGEELAKSTRKRTLAQRKAIQYIFQSPYSSLNPRRTLGQSLSVPLQMSKELNAHDQKERVMDALDAVRLGRQFYERRPGDLSGGERQRAAIARALVNMPSVLICDEITSALDVSVQASIVSLLHTLQEERGLSMLFVTHNIALAPHVASRVAVLDRGVIVESGPVSTVLKSPQHDYTQELLANVPTL